MTLPLLLRHVHVLQRWMVLLLRLILLQDYVDVVVVDDNVAVVFLSQSQRVQTPLLHRQRPLPLSKLRMFFLVEAYLAINLEAELILLVVNFPLAFRFVDDTCA